MATYRESLVSLQERSSRLNSKRDSLNRELGIEEQKLASMHASLESCGIKNPEKLSDEELSSLIEKTQNEIKISLEALETEIKKGESIVSQFEEGN